MLNLLFTAGKEEGWINNAKCYRGGSLNNANVLFTAGEEGLIMANVLFL